MYKNFDTKSLFTLIVFISLLQYVSTDELGVYVSGHVRKNEDNTWETFNDTISKKGRAMNLDIFITQKTSDGNITIQYLDAPNFETTRHMHFAICKKGVDISKVKKKD